MTVTRNTPKKRSTANTLEVYPVGTDGNLIRYLPPWGRKGPGATDEERGISWVPNTVFVETLSLEHIFHGQSAANFVWCDTKARRWPMFLTDVEELMTYGSIYFAQTSGRWQVRKRGQNYGLAMAPEVKTK